MSDKFETEQGQPTKLPITNEMFTALRQRALIAIRELLNASLEVHGEVCDKPNCHIQTAVSEGEKIFNNVTADVQAGIADRLELTRSALRVMKFLTLHLDTKNHPLSTSRTQNIEDVFARILAEAIKDRPTKKSEIN